MYWKEIPVQTQGRDESGAVSRPLDPRFQRGVDAIAMLDGSAGTDDYLMAWEWGAFADADGSAQAAADVLAKRIEDRFPQDFAARIRDMIADGTRDPSPGAADGWWRGD